LDELRQRRSELLAVAGRHGAHNIRVFGSVARGEESASSDVDFLVDLPADRSLLDLVGLRDALADMLGRSVDVVSERGLYPYLRKRILDEAVRL
jgi:predicted nucleotidyltransferase